MPRHAPRKQNSLTADERGQLVIGVINLAQKIAKSFWLSHPATMNAWDTNLEELTSHAYLALVRASISFDPARGVKFTTLATLCVTRELSGLFRRNRECFARVMPAMLATDLLPANRDKTLYAHGWQENPGHALEMTPDGAMADPQGNSGPQAVDDADEVAGVRKSLRGRRRMWHVLKARYIEDKQLQEIGDEIGMCKERARQLICQARSKAKELSQEH